MFNFDYIRKEDIKVRNPNWPKVPDYSHRMSIIGGSETEKKMHY